MSERIVLKVVGPYGEDGWQDPETGEEFYNKTIMSPYGVVKNLKTHRVGDELVIDQAPEYVLIGRGFAESQGYRDAFGAQWVDVIARNGHVRYQVFDRDVVWDDDPEAVISSRLGFLAFSEWKPESIFVEVPHREKIEVPVTREGLQ